MTVYSVRIDSIEVLMDNETERAHTPEVAQDYLTRLASTALSLYVKLPDAMTEADATTEE